MTVIAYDGRYLAADSRSCVNENTIYSKATTTKIRRVRNYGWLACSGNAEDADLVFAWFDHRGHNGNDRPIIAHDIDAVAVEDSGKVFKLGQRLNWPHDTYAVPWAWGCGQAEALGALHFGANAMEACAVSCALDVHCGLPVFYVDTRKPTNHIVRWTGAVPKPKTRR